MWSCDVRVTRQKWSGSVKNPTTFLQLPTMPKKSWAKEEQQTWLMGHLVDFRKAQEAKTTPSFFIDLYQNYLEKWPLSAPNAKELSEADGNEEKAKTDKQKLLETVSGSFTLIYSVA